MAKLGKKWMPHTVMVETRSRGGARGETWSAPRPVRCLSLPKIRTVRTADGNETTSSTTIVAQLKDGPILTVGSRVTLEDGTKTTIITATPADDKGKLGVPQHFQAACE